MIEGKNGGWRAALAILLVGAWLGPIGSSPAMAEDRLLQEVVEFTGTIVFLEHKVPGLVIGAVRNGERTVAGFGETSTGSGIAPDGKTTLRIGSLTKTMTGAVLASLAADGTVALTDPLEQHLGWSTVPARDGKTVRLVDLATHAGGFPREVPHEPGPPDNPFATITQDAFIAALENDALLFAPGTGALYSNMGFDLLAAGLSGAAAKPYPDLLGERVTGPLGMTDTAFELNQDQKARLMQGHDFAGEPLPDVPTAPMIVGSGGLYSTVDDVLTWLEWQLDRFSATDAEMRHIGQAIWLQRDNLSPAFGLDESGRADALALAWIVMMPEGDRPLILQKAGGLQGVFCYAAFAPTRGIGAFIAINTFDLAAAQSMADAINGMIAALAQR
jgi:serine-type D-Ala-D-Ala carboxypeptidase/endopeptidase